MTSIMANTPGVAVTPGRGRKEGTPRGTRDVVRGRLSTGTDGWRYTPKGDPTVTILDDRARLNVPRGDDLHKILPHNGMAKRSGAGCWPHLKRMPLTAEERELQEEWGRVRDAHAREHGLPGNVPPPDFALDPFFSISPGAGSAAPSNLAGAAGAEPSGGSGSGDDGVVDLVGAAQGSVLDTLDTGTTFNAEPSVPSLGSELGFTSPLQTTPGHGQGPDQGPPQQAYQSYQNPPRASAAPGSLRGSPGAPLALTDALTDEESSIASLGSLTHAEQDERSRIQAYKNLLAGARPVRPPLTYKHQVLHPRSTHRSKFSPATAARWEDRHHIAVSNHNKQLHDYHREFFSDPQAFDMCTKPRSPIAPMPIAHRIKPRPPGPVQVAKVGSDPSGGPPNRWPPAASTSPAKGGKAGMARRHPPADSYNKPFAVARKTDPDDHHIPVSLSI